MSTTHNTCERLFEGLARRNGWEPTRRGWPDFMCFAPDGELIVVEVKRPMRSRSGTVILRRSQARLLRALQAKGIRCYVSDGLTLTLFDPTVHDQEARRYSRHRQASPREPGEP